MVVDSSLRLVDDTNIQQYNKPSVLRRERLYTEDYRLNTENKQIQSLLQVDDDKQIKERSYTISALVIFIFYKPNLPLRSFFFRFTTVLCLQRLLLNEQLTLETQLLLKPLSITKCLFVNCGYFLRMIRCLNIVLLIISHVTFF